VERRGTTARWFRWKSSHEEWPGSVSEVRGSSPGGRSGEWKVDGGSPRRIEGRQSGGRGRRWCSVLGVRAAKEKERNEKGLNLRSLRQLRRSEGREEAPAFATAAARWRSAGARAGEEKGVASVGRPQEGRLGRRSSWGRRVGVKRSRWGRGVAGNGGRRRCSKGAEE
jgi:hypothetical protein